MMGQCLGFWLFKYSSPKQIRPAKTTQIQHHPPLYVSAQKNVRFFIIATVVLELRERRVDRLNLR
jgi:hypothetical protein